MKKLLLITFLLSSLIGSSQDKLRDLNGTYASNKDTISIFANEMNVAISKLNSDDTMIYVVKHIDVLDTSVTANLSKDLFVKFSTVNKLIFIGNLIFDEYGDPVNNGEFYKKLE